MSDKEVKVENVKKTKVLNSKKAVFGLKKDPSQHYNLVEVIGYGGFGVVYRAVSKEDGRDYAIKVIHLISKSDYVNMEREIRLLKKLKGCPYIVQYHESFFHKRKLWIVLEYCYASLSDVMKVLNAPFNEEELSCICRIVLQSLVYLHSHNIIHRDIKASNILITKRGKIKMVDFGISRELSQSQSRANSFVGSPFWMSPEIVLSQGGGTYTKKIDIWSLGITLIQLAELEPPKHQVHPMRVIFSIINDPSPSFSSSPSSNSSSSSSEDDDDDDSKNSEEKRPTAKDLLPERSDEIREFLQCCVEKDPEKRKNADELLNHPFITKYKDSDAETLISLKIEEMETLYGKYGGRRQFYKHKQKEAKEAKEKVDTLLFKKVSKEIYEDDDDYNSSSEGDDDDFSESGSSSSGTTSSEYGTSDDSDSDSDSDARSDTLQIIRRRKRKRVLSIIKKDVNDDEEDDEEEDPEEDQEDDEEAIQQEEEEINEDEKEEREIIEEEEEEGKEESSIEQLDSEELQKLQEQNLENIERFKQFINDLNSQNRKIAEALLKSTQT